jgi:hypothetical protein
LDKINKNSKIQSINYIKSENDYYAGPWTSDGQIADTRFHQVSAIPFKIKIQ